MNTDFRTSAGRHSPILAIPWCCLTKLLIQETSPPPPPPQACCVYNKLLFLEKPLSRNFRQFFRRSWAPALFSVGCSHTSISPKFIWAPCAQLYSLADNPQPLTPLPTHLGSYTRSPLVSQDRRHLCVTTWLQQSVRLNSFNSWYFYFLLYDRETFFQT